MHVFDVVLDGAETVFFRGKICGRGLFFLSKSFINWNCSIFGFALSHVIGTVICDYCEWAEMIAREGRSPQQALFDKAAKGEELRFFKTISRLIFHGGRRHVSKESRIYNWTITKDARHALGNDTLSKNETYSFVAEIHEEYSEMNYSLREKIMLRNTISVIDRAVSGEKAEIISYKTRHGNTRKIVPYKIIKHY